MTKILNFAGLLCFNLITLMMTGCVLGGNIKGLDPCGGLDYSTTTR